MRVELFAPVFRPAQIVNGKVVFREKLLTIYYVFVKGTLTDVKELCAKPDNGLSLMLDRGSDNRYGIISDTAMNNFKIMARIFSNEIPFYNIEDVKLEEGDVIEVIDGNYAGLVGTYMPKPRSNKGHLVIAANGKMGAIIWDIDAKYLRILKFADNTKRQYDILDGFIAKFLPILRKLKAGIELTDRDKTQLVVFNRRMGAVSLGNPKYDAKLAATLMCVQTILGDKVSYENNAVRFNRKKAAVTNPWVRALIDLMLSFTDESPVGLENNYRLLKSSTETLTSQKRQLLEEYAYYLE